MKNVQISLDEETLEHVDRAAGMVGLTRSEIVRQALRQWLRRRMVESFEQEWVTALGKEVDDPGRTEPWLLSDSWSRK